MGLGCHLQVMYIHLYVLYMYPKLSFSRVLCLVYKAKGEGVKLCVLENAIKSAYHQLSLYQVLDARLHLFGMMFIFVVILT